MTATKIQAFAKEQFGIILTDAQLQYIAIVASGQRTIATPPRFGKSTANKVIYAWLQEGLKLNET